jgi:hypothetical protein
MGYNVVAIDVEPEPYLSIAESCGVDVVKCDLEKDELKVTMLIAQSSRRF